MKEHFESVASTATFHSPPVTPPSKPRAEAQDGALKREIHEMRDLKPETQPADGVIIGWLPISPGRREL